MKIVDVCAFYSPRGGGVRTYIDRKLEAGARAGHEIVVVAPGERDGIERRGDGARVRWLRSPPFPLDRNYRFFADRAALHQALDEERPDVLEVSSPWRSASLTADWPGRARRSLVAHADPLSAYAYRWFGPVASTRTIDRAFDWYWRHLRKLDERFDHVVSASPSLTARLRAGGLNKVSTIAMGVEADRFSPSLRDPALRRTMLALCGLPEGATLLIGVGRHAPEKRWHLVVDAVALAGGASPVGLVIVGGGTPRRALLSAIGDNPHVRLLAPIRDRDALARTMASADGLIHGCEAETFCFAVAEAIASGIPVIAPDGGGAGDLARASGGHVYPPGSARAAAAAIRDLAARSRPRAVPRPRTMEDHFADLFDLYAAPLGDAGRQVA